MFMPAVSAPGDVCSVCANPVAPGTGFRWSYSQYTNTDLDLFCRTCSEVARARIEDDLPQRVIDRGIFHH